MPQDRPTLSPWVRIPLLVVLVLALLAGGYFSYLLSMTTPAMYDPIEIEEPIYSPSLREDAEMIVYTSLRPENWDIYLFDNLDAAPRRLTDHPNLDYNAVLSSDGRWVVFVSERDGNANLYAIDLTAEGEPIALTTHPGMDDAPALSPDGRSLAFVSTREGNPDIYIMPFTPGDTGAEAQAVNISNDPYGDFNPSFSPDGSQIAFSSNRSLFGWWNPARLMPDGMRTTEIYVADTDGGNQRRVVNAMSIAGSPAWTNKGDAILYYKAADALESAVYRKGLSSAGTVQLSSDSLVAFTPTAGPDSSVIFVGFDRTERPEGKWGRKRHGGRIYWVASDGKNPRELTHDGRMYLAPFYDARTGRLVCHGDGPAPEEQPLAKGTPFTWPGALRTIRLPDRSVRLHTLGAYFPSLTGRVDRIFAVQDVHEKNHRADSSAIVSILVDGSDVQPIYALADGETIRSPVATSDGARVFFSKGRRSESADADVDIWKVRTDTTEAVNLTPDSDASDAYPNVSADGEWVVFQSSRDADKEKGEEENIEIYLMDREGERVRRISHAKGIDTMPAISPDGKRVVYATDRTGKGMKLWIQSLEDSADEGHALEPERAHLTGLDMHPRFSPDGAWIIFTSDRAGYMDEWPLSGMYAQPFGELYAIRADGSGAAQRLTHDKWEDTAPFWGVSSFTAAQAINFRR